MGQTVKRDYTKGNAVLKNTAGQNIGAQMTNVVDGLPFTGAVVVYVTGDGGTQVVGSVGAGACVHEGKGLHTYSPAQAETNYNHIAWTFEGAGAITVTVQIYPEVSVLGSGNDSVTIEIEDDGVPVPDVSVWITADAAGVVVVAGTLVTNATGEATFLLTAGVTYYLWANKSGKISITGQSFVAVAD